MYLLSVIATITGATATENTKLRADLGQTPSPSTPPTPSPPETWKDKCAGAVFWLIVFSPAISIAAFAGMALYLLFKILFARHGIDF